MKDILSDLHKFRNDLKAMEQTIYHLTNCIDDMIDIALDEQEKKIDWKTQANQSNNNIRTLTIL